MTGVSPVAAPSPLPLGEGQRREGAFAWLTLALLLVAPVAVLAPKGMSVLVPALALLAAFAARPAPRAVLRGAAPALPLLAVALLSALWSITPAASAERALLFALEILFATLLATSLPARTLVGIAGAAAIGALLILEELLAGGRLTQALRHMPPDAVLAALSNGTTVVVLLAPAGAAALWRKGHRLAAVALLLLAGAAALLGGQIASRLGFAAGLGAAALGLLWRHAIRAAAAAASLLVLCVPLLLPLPILLACRAAGIKLSVTHRMFIWNFAESKRAEKPFTGWGLETTRAIPGGRDHADLWTPCGLPLPAEPPSTELLPLHTHNAAIQLWLELGPAGVLAACLLLLALAFLAQAPDRAGRAAQAATLAAAVVIALSSYGAWQGWWVATLALAVASATALNHPPFSQSSSRHPPPPSAP